MKYPTPVFSQTGRMCVATLATIVTFLSPVLLEIVHSQVTTAITPSGLNTAVTPNGNVQNITGGTRVETNLFHSFGQFSVATGDIASFQNTLVNGAFPVTSNILGRVTGGQPSQIFGTLRTTDFGNANLFLINPRGVIFGPTASLDIGATSVPGTPRGAGSFYASTTDYMRLSDGVTNGYFYADAGRESTLTSAPVVAFGFLGSSPGAISVQGSELSVANDQAIGLVGGNIEIQAGTITDGTTVTTQAARLSAPNGQIQLASAMSPGEFVLSNLQQPATNVDGASFTAFGLMTLASDSTSNVSGTNTVSIRGGEFVLSVNDAMLTTAATAAEAGTIALRNGSAIVASTQGTSSSGDIEITANTIELNGSAVRTESSGTGDAGNITIALSDVLSLSTSGITSVTFGSGTSGIINVTGRPSVSLEDGSVLLTQTTGDNRAGDINLTVGNLTTNSGSGIESVGSDSASSGSIAINATDTISLSAGGIVNRNEGFGGTGGISLTTGKLQLSDGSVIRSDTFFGLEGAETPKIAIAARDTMTLSGGSQIAVNATLTDVGAVEISAHSITLADRGFIDTTTGGPGNAGAVTLNTHDLLISGGGLIRSSTVNDSGFGGAITVMASGNVSISGTDSGIFSDSSTPVSSAQGGGILVSAQQIEVANGGAISAKTTLSGNAGDITLKANSVNIESGGQLTSSSVRRAPLFEGDEAPLPTGNAGSVTIQGIASPANSVVIEGAGSGIFTTTEGTGAGGDITILASESVTLTKGGTISASSTGQMPNVPNAGNAGNIEINAGATFLMTNSSVTTQAVQAGGGKISVKAGDMVRLTNSQINTSVADGTGGGGNITIDPNFTILQNSQILAQAFAGQGGNINITTGVFLADANSLVDASSQFGLSGTVTIQSPTSNLSAVWARLQQNYTEAAALLRARCAAQVSGQYSSFVQTGRDAIPLEPGGWLLSPLGPLGAGKALGARGEGHVGSETEIVSLRGFDQNLSWPGLVQAPRRFHSILDSACGS